MATTPRGEGEELLKARRLRVVLGKWWNKRHYWAKYSERFVVPAIEAEDLRRQCKTGLILAEKGRRLADGDDGFIIEAHHPCHEKKEETPLITHYPRLHRPDIVDRITDPNGNHYAVSGIRLDLKYRIRRWAASRRLAGWHAISRQSPGTFWREGVRRDLTRNAGTLNISNMVHCVWISWHPMTRLGQSNEYRLKRLRDD